MTYSWIIQFIFSVAAAAEGQTTLNPGASLGEPLPPVGPISLYRCDANANELTPLDLDISDFPFQVSESTALLVDAALPPGALKTVGLSIQVTGPGGSLQPMPATWRSINQILHLQSVIGFLPSVADCHETFLRLDISGEFGSAVYCRRLSDPGLNCPGVFVGNPLETAGSEGSSDASSVQESAEKSSSVNSNSPTPSPQVSQSLSKGSCGLDVSASRFSWIGIFALLLLLARIVARRSYRP